MQLSRDPMAVLIEQADAFKAQLAAIRAQQPPAPGLQWYPYNSFGNLKHLSAMLGEGHRASITNFIPKGRIADIGCGNGDLGLFFASLGCTVDLVDTPAPNMNKMMGVRTLRNVLDLNAGIIEKNLEGSDGMLDKRYDFALVLGLLYHLRNPYQFLDRLARRVSMIVLSTKVTSYVTRPDGERVCVEGLPLGYLIGASECNNDDTNYWTFTSAGLNRLFERTGWRLLDYYETGDMATSDAVSKEGDRRAFCLLHSQRV